ncbi:MAG: hypothetical protein NTV46_16455, partial [Verrucomicrobia bacterium]|nr:hypothetical protein [Verrucomicrobiota bacterium]
MMMLEDDFTYVLRKALTGHALTPAEAAAQAGLPAKDVHSFLRGTFSATSARKLAGVLRLNAEAFARHAAYVPQPLVLSGIVRLDLPFGGERVNAWLVRASGACILFDGGYDPRDLLQTIESLGV